MPLEKQYNRLSESAAPTLLKAATATTGSSTLAGWGVEFVTSTSTGTQLTLPNPMRGMVQTVVYAAGGATASTAAVLIHTHSTAAPFMGSTSNTLALDAAAEVATFYGFSTAQWAFTLSGSTVAPTLTATTGA